MTYGHRTGYRTDLLRDRIVPVPPDLDPLLGIYVAHMGPICANGLLHAAVEEVGRDVRALGDGVRGRRVASSAAAWSACSPGSSPATTAPTKWWCSTRPRCAGRPRRAWG